MPQDIREVSSRHQPRHQTLPIWPTHPALPISLQIQISILTLRMSQFAALLLCWSCSREWRISVAVMTHRVGWSKWRLMLLFKAMPITWRRCVWRQSSARLRKSKEISVWTRLMKFWLRQPWVILPQSGMNWFLSRLVSWSFKILTSTSTYIVYSLESSVWGIWCLRLQSQRVRGAASVPSSWWRYTILSTTGSKSLWRLLWWLNLQVLCGKRCCHFAKRVK